MKVTKSMRRIAESAAASVQAQIDAHALIVADDLKRKAKRTRLINETMKRIHALFVNPKTGERSGLYEVARLWFTVRIRAVLEDMWP